MHRTVMSFVAAVAAACLTALAPARAEVPAALDLVPPDALLVVATSSLEDMDEDVSGLFAAAGRGEIPGPAQMLAVAGLRNGLRMSGSAALAIMPGDLDQGPPPVVAILPTSDYKALLGNFGAQANGEITEMSIEGSPAYARDIGGGYAIVSPIKELVAAFRGKGGHLNAHREKLGDMGVQLVSRGDLVVVGNVAALAPLLEQRATEMKQQMQMMAAMGGQQQQAQALAGMMDSLMTALQEEGQAMVVSFDAEALGMSIDTAVTFKAGSDSAKLLEGRGRADRILKNLPAKPFIFAYAGDGSHPLMKRIVEWQQQMQAGAGEGMFGGMGMFGPDAMQSDGFAMALYPNPGGPMAGFLANTLMYSGAEDPATMRKAMKDGIEQMKQMAGQGLPINPSYTENEDVVDGVQVDGWSMALNMNNPQAQQMMMVSNMLFGPSGLGGYVATTDDGVFFTMSRNKQLLSEALAASKNGVSLLSQGSTKQVADKLPDDRLLEGYFNLAPVLQQLLPFIQMMAPGMQMQPPQDLPPVGYAIVADDGALRMTGYAPTAVIKTAVQLAEAAQQAQAQMQQRNGQGGRPPF